MAIIRLLYVIYACVVFFLLMLLVFVWALLVLPLGRIKGGNLIYYGCMVWAAVWFFLIGIRHRNIYLQKPRKDRSYIYVSNHISYLDAALIPKTLLQPVRPLGKVEMAKIPVFGFIYRNVIVTVDRSNADHRTKSVHLLKSILRKGISILVFPEGTFNMTGKPLRHFYDGAFRVAVETGTPIKPVILLDSFDRMHYRSVFTLNPGRSRSLFLHEIPVDGYTLATVHELKQKVHNEMEKAIIEYKAGWIM